MSIGNFLKNLVFETSEVGIVNSNVDTDGKMVEDIQSSTDTEHYNMKNTINSTIKKQSESQFSEDIFNHIIKELSDIEISYTYLTFKKMFMDENNIKILPNPKERGQFIFNTLKLSNPNINKETIVNSIESCVAYVLEELGRYNKFYSEKIIELDELTKQSESKLNEIEELTKKIEQLNQERIELETKYSNELAILSEQQMVGNASYEEVIRVIEEDKKTIETEL